MACIEQPALEQSHCQASKTQVRVQEVDRTGWTQILSYNILTAGTLVS